jgi:cation:H+ antiporter
MTVDTAVLAHDIRYFFIGYAVAIGVAFLPLEPVWPKWIAAFVLLAIYIQYVRAHFSGETEAGDPHELSPLRFGRLDPVARRSGAHEPRLRTVNLQVVFSLGLIIAGAVVFVDAVEHLAATIGVNELLLALIVAPIATELPEKFNSILWVRKGKDTLAMGNITGAMVFQSTIPTVFELLFASSSWSVGEGSYLAFLSAGIAFVSMIVIFVPMARRGTLTGRHLLIGGLFYLAYLGVVIGAEVRPG